MLRAFKILSIGMLVVSFASAARAQSKEITVFDIRRPVSLENNVELPKDFFINAGLEAGLKVGMVITVNRRQTLYDPYQGKSPGELIVPVGQLRVIHAQDNLSVARLVEIMGREELPTLEFDAVMVGDRLDMSTAKMGKAKRAEQAPEGDSSRKTASEVVAVEIEVGVPQVVTAAAVVPQAVTPAISAAPATTPVTTAATSATVVAPLPTVGANPTL